MVQDPGHFEIAVQQLAAAMLDATGLCLFARPPVFGDPQLMVDLINGRYGWGWSVAIAVSVTEVAYQRGLATPPSDFAVRYLGWLQNLTTKRRGAQSHARGNPHGQPMLESEPGRPG